MSSESATASVPCTRCRQRRVKCDKTLPHCRRCQDRDQPCPGYNRLRAFIDEGAALRERNSDHTSQQSSPDSEASSQRRRQGASNIRSGLIRNFRLAERHGGTAVASTSRQQAASIERPVQIEDHLPARDGVSALASPAISLPNPAAPNDASVAPGGDLLMHDEFFDLDPELYYADGRNCCGWVTAAATTVPIDSSEDMVIPGLSPFSNATFSTQFLNDPNAGSDANLRNEEGSTASIQKQQEVDQETMLLLQHFSAHIGPCLDVFDTEQYYTCIVPSKALQSSMLMNLVAAISAKHFIKSCRSKTGSDRQDSSLIELLLSGQGADAASEWLYKAASFYDKAISSIVTSLTSMQKEPALRMSAVPEDDLGHPRAVDGSGNLQTPAIHVQLHEREGESPGEISSEGVGNLLVAVSLSLFYESLDHSKGQMLSHISGAYDLLETHIPSSVSQTGTHIDADDCSDMLKAWRASFWHVAHSDIVLSSFARSRPRLSWEMEVLWTAAGLSILRDGQCAVPQPLRRVGLVFEDKTPLTGPMAYKVLLWIMFRAVDYAASQQSHVAEQSSGPSVLDHLTHYLESWSAALPPTFQPLVVVPYAPAVDTANTIVSMASTSAEDDIFSMTGSSFISISYYSSPLASISMALFHSMEIFLLLHKPFTSPSQTSTSSFAQFASARTQDVRAIVRKLEYNADKICGIALSQAKDTKRMRMLQCLYMAGLCFELQSKRRMVVGLLEEIEIESGHSTGWILDHLREGWDASSLVNAC